MGRLATYGIFGGKRTPVEELVDAGRCELDQFSRKVLNSSGFLQIAEKIEADEHLTIQDFTLLLRRASIPVLMKLVELRGRRPFYAPTPVVLLPLNHWSENYGLQEAVGRGRWFLEQIESDDLRVVLDGVNTHPQTEGFLDAIREISGVRPGLTLVGPSAEEIVHRVTIQEGIAEFTPVRAARMVQLLRTLKESGISGLRPSSTTALMRLAHKAGFQPLLTTPVDGYGYAEDLAKNFFEINRHSGSEQVIRSWSPCIKNLLASRMAHPARDLVLLRALAVGAIGLKNVPCIQASSRYFSLDAIRVATLFGANDAGLGAANSETASQLLLLPFKTLRTAFPSPDGLTLLTPQVQNGGG